jgi:hypothetical protein
MLTLAGPVLDHDRLTKPIANAGSKLAASLFGRPARSLARLLNFVEKLREQIAQLDCRSRFAIGIKRHGAIAFAIDFPSSVGHLR